MLRLPLHAKVWMLLLRKRKVTWDAQCSVAVPICWGFTEEFVCHRMRSEPLFCLVWEHVVYKINGLWGQSSSASSAADVSWNLGWDSLCLPCPSVQCNSPKLQGALLMSLACVGWWTPEVNSVPPGHSNPYNQERHRDISGSHKSKYFERGAICPVFKGPTWNGREFGTS